MFKLKSISVALALGLVSAAALASPCDRAAIEIYNQTKTPLELIDQDAYGETKIADVRPGFVLESGAGKTVYVESGLGTRGHAKGVLTFLNKENLKDTVAHKLVSVSFNFQNNFWVNCTKTTNVVNTQSDKFKVYTVPGYNGNVKVYIVE